VYWYWTLFGFYAFPVVLVFQLALMTPPLKTFPAGFPSAPAFRTLKGTSRESWPVLAQKQQ